MRVILDTNVFVSGVFFKGPPYQILEMWRDGKIQLVLSPEILVEYQRVGNMLASQFPGVDIAPVIDLLTVEAEMVFSPGLPDPVCDDREDDKFFACALASKTRLIVSGDKHLLKVSGYKSITVVRPHTFIDEYFKE